MKIRNKKLLTKSIAMAIFMSSTLYTMPITHAAFNNNTLPDLGENIKPGNVIIDTDQNKHIQNIIQDGSNAIIKWKDFSIGANATVNFSEKDGGKFNTLNYVDSGNLSQIYGTINATNGNIYIVNTAGVQIGNSAQINVGSLYVSNKNLNEKNLNQFDGNNFNSLIDTSKTSNAELMSLGNINAANKVTFDGNRIVLDVDRVKNGQDQLGAGNITIKTTEADLKNKNVVLGYTAYDGTYKGKNVSDVKLANLEVAKNDTQVEQTTLTKKDGFMWVKDGEQLQAMGSNLSGNYAFRNSIDLNATADNNVTFDSVGDSKNAFTGNLDGLGYEVYGLYINEPGNEPGEDTGLFAKTDGATIRNFNLISGSIISTKNNAGAVVGNANNTVIENVKNTINVTGTNNVGGIIGTGTDVTLNGVVNSGAISGISNVGGLAGSLSGSTLKGESYNLGDIKGSANNIGGLVGSASNSIIGNETGFQIYNHLDVEGGYNVGGIVGNLKDGSTVQNVSNDGTIKATGKIEAYYNYHTGKSSNLPNDAKFENGIATVKVDIANVGGIVGNSDGNTKANIINNVLNNGDVSSNKQDNNDYYDAGNVGGIVGSAVNTSITNATNKENDIRGAHNVGGIAGYFEEGTISNAINNGGDILATGARHNVDFIKESVRNSENAKEEFNIGNMGGIVGYMFGDDSYVELSANRGTVHSAEIKDFGSVQESSKAANTGGIVGKIDRGTTLNLTDINDKEAPKKAAVSNSYNTGNVSGYTGVGGVVGMMYNGEVINSYNLGNIQTTRQVQSNENIPAVNMGGVVGDTTENSGAQALIYNVYNKGQIGDENFEYYARHVGGVVGRLSGTVEKAYNNGAIYNGYSTVGGVVGWWAAGSVNNVFNTGNITVVNNDTQKNNPRGSEVGGIVGSVNDSVTKLTNAYNLGTLRSFVGKTGANNSLGGIIGNIHDTKNRKENMEISNVYTLGNLYVDNGGSKNSINSIYGQYEYGKHDPKDIKVTINNAYYIQPGNNSFADLNNISGTNQHTKAISYSDRTNKNNYTFSNNSDWRMYNGKTTPILNAFMPDSSKYLEDPNTPKDELNGITDVQYGTAYDPLLTIINTNSNIILDWQKLGIYGDAGLAVYADEKGNGGGLTLDNFKNSDKGVGLFGGIIYSDGALNIKSIGDNIGLGSFSKVYGSSININAGAGTVDAYGSIISTGNNNTKGDITITGANVNTYGEIKTAEKNQTTTIDGIGSTVDKKYNDKFKAEDVKNQNAKMPDVAEGYAHTVTAGNDDNLIGDISISATDGDVNIYYGNMEKGIIDTQGDVSLSGNNVYVDSDMVIGGDLTADTGKNSAGEIVLDISNIGKVSLKQYTNNLYKELKNNAEQLNYKKINEIITKLESVNKIDPTQLDDFINYLLRYVDNGSLKIGTTESDISDAIIKGRMHNFLKSFSNKATDKKYINFKGTDNAKITVDLWDGSSFKLNKYDLNSTTINNTLSTELSNLNITKTINNKTTELSGREVTYIWVADGEQLKGIQTLAGTNFDVLNYNFALKNDINATDVKDYQAIGDSTNSFTGKFDGRGNRIIGLNVSSSSSNDNVGVFGTIGEKGIVKNLKVYSSTFKGYDNVGAIAGTNKGTIDNVTTLGNTVEALGSANSAKLDGAPVNSKDNVNVNVGAAGGVVGTNTGTVNNATSRDSVIAGEATKSTTILTTAGGIAGINNGLVSNSQSHSAVTASKTSTYSLGGIVGVNTAKDDTTDDEITAGLDNVNAYGVTSGIYSETGNKAYATSSNIGGIAGVNSGTLHDAYNESIVKGKDNVGGIAGTNAGDISLIVNGASVTAEGNYTGGLVGSTTGNISDGRNNGVIVGNKYVGGLVGSNGTKDITKITLKNLTNDSSAEIIGNEYVGGIAGSNYGTITAEDQTNLINRGSITGNKYVGGIAGENNGTITNVNNDIVLNAIGENAQYFGGVTGRNTEKGIIEDATNSGNINASGATYVGGITGQNDGILSGAGNSNEGKVTGKDYVGGVAGLNTKNAKITANDNGSVGTEDNIIVIKNEGEVIAEAGGAGGIFGKNEANIQYAEFVNSGTVTGTAGTTGTGGIFGENTGDIKYSSLKNEVKGNVSGVNNVGGLIGINSGTIAGGRDDANTYYKYQIYNNGTITATGNGSNIGGLIGYNKKDTTTGSLTAGYNTGVIDASNSSNVGGIVGNNEGIVKEVFNTIAGNGSVTGNTNVGGLIGTNSGELSNAYSTSTVVGNASVGNAVGDNKNGTVTHIYATNTSGNLIGTNNETITKSYSFSSSDDGKKGITYLETEASQKNKNNYTSFDEKNTWKFYDGNANPLLKVFLTKAEFVPAKDKDGNNVKPNFVYNGKQQGVLIRYNEDESLVEVLDAKNIVIGTIKVADEDAAHSLEDYINTRGQGNQLINGVQFVDAGTYEMLFSQQINTDGEKGNPNNLGFDFVTSLDNTNPNDKPPTITNDKAKLTITGNDLDRIYGNTDIQNGDYGITIDGWVNGEDFSGSIRLDENSIKDGALTGNTTGKVTNNAGDYTWTGNIIGSLKNYEFDTTVKGDSKVNKATIDIVAGDTTMNKGGNPAYSGSISGIVNGDSIDTVFGSNWDWGIKDSSLTDTVGTHKGVITINIDGKYYYFADQQELSNALKNYNVNIEAGDLTVKDNGGSVPIVPIEPIKPVVPGIWSHIYQDQWDRNRDFKERKAEFNFVNGAIPLDEAVEEV